MKAAVVILNFNGKNHLERFLPSVVTYTPTWAEIIVADNASTDDSIAFMEANYPEIKLIKLSENTGYAGGYNRALEHLDHPYFVLLNSDIEVTHGWLDSLIAFMDTREDVMCAQPKIKDLKDKARFEYAGASGGFIDKYWFPFCRGRIFDHCEKDIGQHDKSREVFWASGACFVVRKEAFWSVKGFDENLFAHMEEIDLCWRLKNQGARVYCIPESTVYHLGGGTLDAQNPRKTYLNFRNNLYIAVKNEYRSGLFRKMFVRMSLDGMAAFHFLFTKGIGHFMAVMKAHFHFYINLPSTIRKRKYWRSQVKTPNQTGSYKASIVKEFYFNRKRAFSALTTRLFVRQHHKK